MTLPSVHIIVLGGTISMAPASAGGIVPTLDGDDLMRGVPGLSDVAAVTVETPMLKPGASLTFSDVAAVVARIAASPASGIVVVQGTDTIDEVGFLIDLLYGGSKPMVVTGAMRGATAPSADGPANLAAAVRVAASEQVADLGTLVVLNDEIHLARFVEKNHKSSLSAFGSPNGGAIGLIAEDRVHVLRRPAHDRPSPFEHDIFPPVPIIKIGLDNDDRLLRSLAGLGYKGVVVEGFGAGHVPLQVVPAIDALAGIMPVVLSSRVPGGPIFRQTYAFPGSEIDLLKRGLIPAGWLTAAKARILLSACLGAGMEIEGTAAIFADWSQA